MEPVLDLELTNLAEAEARLLAGIAAYTRGLEVASHAQALAVARQLGENLQREFRARGHDKSSGIPEDQLGRKATVNDVEVYPTAFGAICSMGGAASLVQFGSRPHGIDAKDGGFLHFFSARDGHWFVGKHVNHPGYAGDDFLSPAIASLDLTRFNLAVVSDAYTALLRRLG